MDLITFEKLMSDASGSERLAMFSWLPREKQEEFWESRRRVVELSGFESFLHEQDEWGFLTREELSKKKREFLPRDVSPVAPRSVSDRDRADDMRLVPASVYVLGLVGVEASERMMCCPLPDHEERTPSFRVYEESRSWYCWGCSRGGGIFEFAANVWGFPTPLRGDSFSEVRQRLEERFS